MRWLLLFALAGCTRGLDLPESQVDCSMFTDEQSCIAAGCATQSQGCGCPDETPTFACVDKGTAQPDFCSNGCGRASCSDFTDEASCDAQSYCYAMLSADEKCNSEGCDEHFVACVDGPAMCAGTACPTPGNIGCDPGTTPVWTSADTCMAGCVQTSKCGD